MGRRDDGDRRGRSRDRDRDRGKERGRDRDRDRDRRRDNAGTGAAPPPLFGLPNAPPGSSAPSSVPGAWNPPPLPMGAAAFGMYSMGRSQTRERSMTTEPPAFPDVPVPQEVLLCQACAGAPADTVCYDCSADGALYCEPCNRMVHADAMLSGHTNAGPVLRCRRGDCNGQLAVWWCSICKDVCEDCARKNCSNHRDKEAVLIKQSTKNAEMNKKGGGQAGKAGELVAKEDSGDEDDSSSDSSDSSSSTEQLDREERRRRRRKRAKNDELVPTWAKGLTKEELEQKAKDKVAREQIKRQKRPGEPDLGSDNPKQGTKLGHGVVIGEPPPPRRHTCSYCRNAMQQGAPRYRCSVCSDPPYDLCQGCFSQVQHKHDDFLLIFGMSLVTVQLPAAAKARVERELREQQEALLPAPMPVVPERQPSPGSPPRGRAGSPCKKFWEGRCEEPCPWNRPHIKQERPDHCCYICGGTGHFAKECPNRRHLEDGVAQVPEERPLDEPDDGIGFNNMMGIIVKQVPTDEERLAKALVRFGQMQDRLSRLQKLRKKKKLRAKGAECSDDEDREDTLREGIEDLTQPDLGPTNREGTPTIDEFTEEQLTGQPKAEAPKPPEKDELKQYKTAELYDASREKFKGAEVPGADAEDAELDEEFSETFEKELGAIGEPLREKIVEFVKKKVLKRKDRHREIMCCIEMRLQDDDITALEHFTAWCVADAVMKRAGGFFVRDIKENMGGLCEAALPCQRGSSGKWRKQSRDMIRSWEGFIGRRDVRKLLDACK